MLRRAEFFPALTGGVSELRRSYAARQHAGPTVVWTPADVPLYEGPEPDQPFGLPTEWRLMAVDGEGPPRLLYETPRWVVGTIMTEDGSAAVLRFISRLPGQTENGLEGQVAVDAAAGGLRWQLPVLAGNWMSLSPRGDMLLSGQDQWLFTPSGQGYRLDGALRQGEFYGWTPDGSAFIKKVTERTVDPTSSEARLYEVPLKNGVARPASGVVEGTSQPLAWSPDGSKMAYVDKKDLFVYDRSSGAVRQVTREAALGTASPLWSKDGRWITVEGALVEVSTGKVTHLEPDAKVMAALVSPDGRQVAVIEDVPFNQPPARRCPGGPLQNRVLLYDIASAETRVLLDCGQGFHVAYAVDSSGWLADGRHLLFNTPNCWACEPSAFTISLADTVTGEVRLLNQGDYTTTAAVSPDGRQIIATGRTLRLFDSDGNLLREIEAPPGFVTATPAWSPDGARFIYILAPEGVRFGI